MKLPQYNTGILYLSCKFSTTLTDHQSIKSRGHSQSTHINLHQSTSHSNLHPSQNSLDPSELIQPTQLSRRASNLSSISSFKSGSFSAASFALDNVLTVIYAVHDFQAKNQDKLSFLAGEAIQVTKKDDQYGDGWWQGHNLKGDFGLFPQAYTISVLPNLKSQPNSAITSSPPQLIMNETLSEVQHAIDQLHLPSPTTNSFPSHSSHPTNSNSSLRSPSKSNQSLPFSIKINLVHLLTQLLLCIHIRYPHTLDAGEEELAPHLSQNPLAYKQSSIQLHQKQPSDPLVGVSKETSNPQHDETQPNLKLTCYQSKSSSDVFQIGHCSSHNSWPPISNPFIGIQAEDLAKQAIELSNPTVFIDVNLNKSTKKGKMYKNLGGSKSVGTETMIGKKSLPVDPSLTPPIGDR
ncbi:hypothetical protein O181_072834 [Austropuccinia psidii MF-1]|uniref:SH3 domain-containing protein n=1 Tax=Austropuccinia psidii MF-1 TaxID=1389203 RepID=A0A9Q3F5Y3_9BASI|nr:hypothetical protein [Austropuccinia psidii MF-1]